VGAGSTVTAFFEEKLTGLQATDDKMAIITKILIDRSTYVFIGHLLSKTLIKNGYTELIYKYEANPELRILSFKSLKLSPK
jgi:hypothetical protein